MHYSRWAQRKTNRDDVGTRQKERQHGLCRGPGCDRDAHSKGLCKAHHRQMRKGQELRPLRRKDRTLIERLFEKVRQDSNGCWLWTGATTLQGQRGCIRISGRSIFAYRAMYEALEGPIPEGLTLDHLCFNPLCVNPGHVEPATLAENSRRQAADRVMRITMV